MSNFGEVLSSLIFDAKVSYQKLADDLGVALQTVYRWKSNKQDIGLLKLVALCEYFGCSIEYLIGRTDVITKPDRFTIENFGSRVRAMMKVKGISTYRMRKETPYGSRYFERWDNGADPQLSTLIELANYFKCTLDELVGLE